MTSAVVVVVVVIAVIWVHVVLSKSARSPWLGSIIPLIWVLAVLFIWTEGALKSRGDVLFAVGGFLGLLIIWHSGQRGRQADDSCV